MKLSNKQKAILAVIASDMIWGAGAPIFKWSLQDIHPFTLAFLRFFIATLILLPFAKTHLKIHRADVPKIILVGFFGITINITFYFFGLLHTASINAPIISSSAPIFIILFSFFLLKEQPKIRTVLGSLVGLLGVTIIVIQPLLEKGLDISIWGNVALIISTLGYILHIVFDKQLSKKYSPITITFYAFLVSSYTFLLPFLYELGHFGLHLQLKTLVGISYGAVFASFSAYLLLHWAMRYLPASEVGLFTYIDPITAVIIAIPLLGEVPTLVYLIGSLLVFVGIFIAEKRIHFHPIRLLKDVEQDIENVLKI